jgi:hypothetical protein
MQALFDELQAAMDADLTPKVIDILVEFADHLCERGDRERAVEILTFALMYPMRAVTFDLADLRFRELEAELCPRVILDARMLAQELTLEDMVKLIMTEYAD